MLKVTSLVLFCMYPIIVAIKDMINVNMVCDTSSEDSNKHCYVKESLASLAHSPNQLAVNKLTNTLYFSIDSGQGEYIPAVLNIDNRKLTILKGIRDAFAMASDPVNEEIYFGGSHGIYKYNPMLKSLKRLGMNNLDIWWLQVKSKLYFIRFPSLKVYYYDNRTVKSLPELSNTTVNQFVFDADDNIFFINSTGLFGVKNATLDVIFLKDNPRFLGMAIDNSGLVHLCSEYGIHVLSKMVQKIKKIISIQGVLGITFDKDNNLIYSDSHEIVRLKPAMKDDYYNFENRE